MPHRNAPLTPVGRLRLIQRCQHRPIAHVAAEAGVSRACLSKWKARYELLGEPGLQDRSSAPMRSPGQLPDQLVVKIEQYRRDKKWSAAKIALELQTLGHRVSTRTVGRWLQRLNLNHRRHLDTDGQNLRRPGKIIARFPGHMIHLDVKKVGRIPDGGGWRAHGRGSEQHKQTQRAKTKGQRAGYVYLHSAVNGFSRLAYTEALGNETAKTTIGFLCRARAFFAAHGIHRIVRIVTDNGSNYRSAAFNRTATSLASKHQRIRPYTPKHNGKVERYQRILSEELLYAHDWTSETQRTQGMSVWLTHYNYHRPHSAAGGNPPASRLRTGVTNVMASNS